MKESDNNVKLIVLDRLDALRSRHGHVFDNLIMDVLQVLSRYFRVSIFFHSQTHILQRRHRSTSKGHQHRPEHDLEPECGRRSIILQEAATENSGSRLREGINFSVGVLCAN